MCLKSLQSSFPMEFLHEKIAQKIADRGATIAIGSQMSFQIEIGIAISILAIAVIPCFLVRSNLSKFGVASWFHFYEIQSIN